MAKEEADKSLTRGTAAHAVIEARTTGPQAAPALLHIWAARDGARGASCRVPVLGTGAAAGRAAWGR